jgi:NADH-quinone oxidoreductase subunit E
MSPRRGNPRKSQQEELETLEQILDEFGSDKKELITILHRVQESFGYIPPEAISRIARRLRISENELFGVLTFYRAFSLQPKGRHVIKVCLGTACHVRGGAQIAEEIGRQLSLAPGQTAADGSFTLETVNCLGCCAIGPVVLVDDNYHGNVTIQKVAGILDMYRDAPESPEAKSRSEERA